MLHTEKYFHVQENVQDSNCKFKLQQSSVGEPDITRSLSFIPVSLRKVNTDGTIVARSRGALINVDLTPGTSKSSGTEALWPVLNSNTKSTVFADTFRTGHILAAILRSSTSVECFFSRMTFEALSLSTQWLEEVERAWSTWCQSSLGVVARLTFLPTFDNILSPRLEGEQVVGTGCALFESIDWWGSSEAVLGTLEARNKTTWAVSAMSTDWDTVSLRLGSLLNSPGTRWAGLAGALSGQILEGSFGTEGAGFFALVSKETGRTLQASGNIKGSNLVEDLSLLAD